MATLRKISGRGLEELVLLVRTSGSVQVDDKTAELMAMDLEPKTWQGRATHMKAVCDFMDHLGLEFPLHKRDLLAFLRFSYDFLLTKTGPQL